jgi:hypothetical protein
VISYNRMILALYRMGYRSRATIHSFQRTASTIPDECGVDRDWIERHLAHSENDEV